MISESAAFIAGETQGSNVLMKQSNVAGRSLAMLTSPSMVSVPNRGQTADPDSLKTSQRRVSAAIRDHVSHMTNNELIRERR